jgi:hypothetical protein
MRRCDDGSYDGVKDGATDGLLEASDGVKDGVLGSEDGSWKALSMPWVPTAASIVPGTSTRYRYRTRYDMLQSTMRTTYVFADFHKSHLSLQ